MIFICILFIFFKFLYVQYIKLTWWTSFSFHIDSCWFIIKSVISMFIHVIICMKDCSKNVSVTNYLQDFSFMFLNKLMILNVWIISLCISSVISQSHFIFQSYHRSILNSMHVSISCTSHFTTFIFLQKSITNSIWLQLRQRLQI